jgi:hypothetical protein
VLVLVSGMGSLPVRPIWTCILRTERTHNLYHVRESKQNDMCSPRKYSIIKVQLCGMTTLYGNILANMYMSHHTYFGKIYPSTTKRLTHHDFPVWCALGFPLNIESKC